jgi:hypothetical protein
LSFLVALGPGLFMTFDGSRGLLVGDYLTPQSGRFAGQPGPWSNVVNSVGIPPRSTTMKVIVLVFGLAWLVAAVTFAQRVPGSIALLMFMAVATLWYVPVGTLMSALVLLGLLLLRRSDQR